MSKCFLLNTMMPNLPLKELQNGNNKTKELMKPKKLVYYIYLIQFNLAYL